jgi:hypothetical protein
MPLAKSVMSRAWAIFRATYHYTAIPFRSIGRKCFAWALRAAWAEVREAKRITVMRPDVKAARIAELREQIMLSEHAYGSRAMQQRQACQAELSRLAA